MHSLTVNKSYLTKQHETAQTGQYGHLRWTVSIQSFTLYTISVPPVGDNDFHVKFQPEISNYG